MKKFILVKLVIKWDILGVIILPIKKSAKRERGQPRTNFNTENNVLFIANA